MTEARPIAEAPRNGQIVLVEDGRGTTFPVFWHAPADGGEATWCYAHMLAPDRPWDPLWFAPVEWRPKLGVSDATG